MVVFIFCKSWLVSRSSAVYTQFNTYIGSIKSDDIVLSERIGQGTIGDVFTARWNDKLVAVKQMFHPTAALKERTILNIRSEMAVAWYVLRIVAVTACTCVYLRVDVYLGFVLVIWCG